MAKNANIDWATHPKLDWEYVIAMSKTKGGTCVAHTLTLYARWGTMPYLLLPNWTKKKRILGTC